MRVLYVPRKFSTGNQGLIDRANEICEGYAEQGLSLTLRQLYYQFVARDLLPNRHQSYVRLGSVIADARMAGLFDWDYIVDRTRNLSKRPHWPSPQRLLDDAAEAYLTDLWAPQKRRVEVWIEKDAAIGVIEGVCERNHVPYFSCRGYTSISEMWNAANRIGEYLRNGERVVILHIGDHDPSGVDMSRDIEERLRTFISRDWANEFMGAGAHTRGDIRRSQVAVMNDAGGDIATHELPWQVKRIALTYEQVLQYNPPPNYAKESDSRFERYQEATGLDESWELDALEPSVMDGLIQDEIDALRVDEPFNKTLLAQEKDRAVLKAVSEHWDQIKAVHAPDVFKKGSTT